MSVVTTVILSTGYENVAAVAEINHQLRLKHQQNPNCPEIEYGYANLKPLSGNNIPTTDDPYFLGGAVLTFWGGSKNPQCELWAGAYNHLDISWFLNLVDTTPWTDQDDVQLFLNREDDATFSVFQFESGVLTEVVEARRV